MTVYCWGRISKYTSINVRSRKTCIKDTEIVCRHRKIIWRWLKRQNDTHLIHIVGSKWTNMNRWLKKNPTLYTIFDNLHCSLKEGISAKLCLKAIVQAELYHDVFPCFGYSSIQSAEYSLLKCSLSYIRSILHDTANCMRLYSGVYNNWANVCKDVTFQVMHACKTAKGCYIH